MKAHERINLSSGAEVIAIVCGQACGFQFEVGTVGRILIRDFEGEQHCYIQFTQSIKLEFSYFSREKWERLVRCGQCERSFPANALSPCGECERSNYCAECLETHMCVIPKMGISRRPRSQKLINMLHAKGETVCR